MLRTHGDQKYGSGDRPVRAADWGALRVEHRWITPGRQNCVRTECTEIVHILSGHTHVRREGDGQLQEGMARAGTNWLVPAGTHETLLELDGPSEWLLIFLPDTLLLQQELAHYDIDPATVRLAYVGGVVDEVMAQMVANLANLLNRERGPYDRVLADGMRTALAAHLIDNYSDEIWRGREQIGRFVPKRLQRVFDFVDANLADDLSLPDLAAEACLSPYHFSRVFRDATGCSPHRFVIRRRIESARAQLAETDDPICTIALESGFSSQANFTRTFRKEAGITPGQYRALHRR